MPDKPKRLNVDRREGEDIVAYVQRMSYVIFRPTEQEIKKAQERARMHEEWVRSHVKRRKQAQVPRKGPKNSNTSRKDDRRVVSA